MFNNNNDNTKIGIIIGDNGNGNSDNMITDILTDMP